MATTTPDNLWTPDSGDDYSLPADLAAFADTIQDAFNNVRDTLAVTSRLAAGGTTITPSTMTSVTSVTLPSDAPAGNYMVNVSTITGATAVATHYQRIQWGSEDLNAFGQDYVSAVPAGTELPRSDSILKFGHPGGSTTITLSVQVNGAGSACRYARLVVVHIGS